jgi:hypothetical protein
MMRYVGSIIGAGILAGVLSGGGGRGDSAGGDVATFQLIMVAVAVTAGLALAAAMFIHRFVDHEPVSVALDPAIEPV